MANQLPFTIAVARIPDANYTPQQLAEAIADRLSISSQETFAIFVSSTTEPTTNVGLWFNPVARTWNEWDDEEGAYVEIEYSPDRIKAGNLGANGAINIATSGKRFNADYPTILFKNYESVIVEQDPYVSGTGTTFDFTLPTPAHFVGPGHALAAGGGVKILNPDADGKARIDFRARIIGDSPDVDSITLFMQKNDAGAFTALASLSSDDAANQAANGIRELEGIAATDSIKFYLAPCSSTGAIPSSITCRIELDIMALNG